MNARVIDRLDVEFYTLCSLTVASPEGHPPVEFLLSGGLRAEKLIATAKKRTSNSHVKIERIRLRPRKIVPAVLEGLLYTG